MTWFDLYLALRRRRRRTWPPPRGFPTRTRRPRPPAPRRMSSTFSLPLHTSLIIVLNFRIFADQYQDVARFSKMITTKCINLAFWYDNSMCQRGWYWGGWEWKDYHLLKLWLASSQLCWSHHSNTLNCWKPGNTRLLRFDAKPDWQKSTLPQAGFVDTQSQNFSVRTWKWKSSLELRWISW